MAKLLPVPASEQRVLDNLIRDLNETYPDKVIVRLQQDHKKWYEKVTRLYKNIGYDSRDEFLAAYGFTVEQGKGGRPSNDLNAIVEELIKRYDGDRFVTSMNQLREENPDLAPKLKNIQNKANDLFGMSFNNYLRERGVFQEKALTVKENDIEGETKVEKHKLTDEEKLTEIEKALIDRYKGKTDLPNSVTQIKWDNKDLKLSRIESLISNIKGIPAKDYFISIGIIPAEKTPEEQLEEIITILKERYIGTEKKAYSISDLAAQNPELGISKLKSLVKKVHDQSSTEYLLSIGVLSENEWQTAARKERERIDAQRAAQRDRFKNDLPFTELLEYYKKTYKEQTTDNPYFDISIPEGIKKEDRPRYSDYRVGETKEITPDGFVIKRGVSYGKPYVELDHYEGKEDVVIVPDDVTTVWGRPAFYNDNIRQIILSSAISDVSAMSFSEEVRKNLADEEGFCIVGKFLIDYFGKSSVVTIPEGVEEITFRAFAEKNNITSVHMPKSIKIIGNQAFANCQNLSKVVFNSEGCSLDRIEFGAFSQCSALTSMNLPKTIKTIGNGAFNGCPIVVNQNGFEIVGNILVKYCGNGTDVYIPEGVKVIGPEAFEGSAVQRVHIPDGVTTICSFAFSRVKTLAMISFPSSLTTIENNAFSICENLTQLDLSNIKSIGPEAFHCCYKLVKMILSNKLEDIGKAAFSSCQKLKIIDLITSDGVIHNILPESLTSIPPETFRDCSDLESISVPGTVKKIGREAFKYCKGLKAVYLSDGLDEIGEECFYLTDALESINIPESVDSIGRDAFFGSKCSAEIELPEKHIKNKGFYGISDNNNCFVENGILTRTAYSRSGEFTITEGVIVIEENALRGVPFNNGNIVNLPNTVRVIKHSEYGYRHGFKMNIPYGYLLQKTKLPAEPLKNLLPTVWKYDASMLDWVSVYLYQNSKQVKDCCVGAFSVAPNAFVAAAIAILTAKCKPSEIDRAGEIVYDLRNSIKQEFMDQYYIFAKQNKAKKTVSILEDFVSDSAGGSLNVVKTFANELEEYCYKKFEKHEIERTMKKAGLNDKSFQTSGVKYAEKDEEVPAFILECAVIPYIGQMVEKPRHIGSFRSDYYGFKILNNCDKIAAQLEKESFAKFIEQFAFKAGGYDTPQIWAPVCRFGSGKQISKLISDMNSWSDWYSCGASGRMGIMVARGAIMLSDTREAMLYAEKCKCLGYYAKLRGMDEDSLRDNVLADFGFDKDGKKSFDIGGNIIDLTMGQDLALTLYDHNADKIVKSVPKKGADPEKQAEAATEVSDIKKNLKKVIKARNNLLFEDFLSGRTRKADSWKASYLNNPVLHKVAELIVWNQKKNTFILTKDSVIDCYGKEYVIDDKIPVGVAHPIEMDKVEIKAWQDYFLNNGLKQPFEQIWEPAINFATVKEDRYKDCLIPYYRFHGQEKHGISVEDYDFHNEIDISLKDCDANVVRIDWSRHDISMNDNFEIASIKIKRESRVANHLLAYFDKITIYGRVLNDETETIVDILPRFTLAQVTEFIRVANENNCNNSLAVLMDYKNKTYTDVDPMDSFILE